MRYKITINGIAAKPYAKNNIVAIKISKNLNIFKRDFADCALSIFNENKGIFIIRRNGIIIVNIIRSCMSKNIGKVLKSAWGIAAKNIANAGVGSPIKDFFCLVSILKLANR